MNELLRIAKKIIKNNHGFIGALLAALGGAASTVGGAAAGFAGSQAGGSLLGGLGSFGLSKLFGGSGRAPQRRNIRVPGLGDLPTANPLFKFAEERLGGIGTGFGPDFLDRSTNPAIKKIEARFKNVVRPRISNRLSKRGVARSAGGGLATDVLGQADAAEDREIRDLISKFFVLEKGQEKRDISEGVGVQEGLLNQAIGLQRLRTGVEAGIDTSNIGFQQQQDKTNLLEQGSIADLISGILQPQDEGNLEALLRQLTKGGVGSTSTDTNPEVVNILDTDDDELDRLILEARRKQGG